MSTIDIYELLKINGTWSDRINYIRSLSDKNVIEQYVKQSTSYEDLQLLVLLSKSIKNEKNLFEICKTSTYPIGQRIIAARSWLEIQTDEQVIYDFTIDIMTNESYPERFKTRVIKSLHHAGYLKKSSTFYYKLACCLSNNDRNKFSHYLLQYCSKEQILDVFSQWSITNVDQLRSLPLLRSKLIAYQPETILYLIQCDLKLITFEKFSNYFAHNHGLLSLLGKKDPKSVCRLAITYLTQLEDHQRSLPSFIQLDLKYYFKKVPDEMIELITLVTSTNPPGTIKYQGLWSSETADIEPFALPHSFSLNHYLRLFFALYDQGHWSTNHTIRLLRYLIQDNKRDKGLLNVRKRRKWLVDIVIDKHIGKENFTEKLLQEGDEATLELLAEYAEITTPLSLHLISQIEMKKNLSHKQRIVLLRHQFLTDELFQQFLALFNQISSNPTYREQFFPALLQCAVSSDQTEQVIKVFRWIRDRFTNERLPVIEAFLTSLASYNDRFHLELLPDNFEVLQSIIDLIFVRFQQIHHSVQIIAHYGSLLLQRAEHYSNKDQRDKIHRFAIKIITPCLSTPDRNRIQLECFSPLYPMACHLLVDILVSETFTKLLSKHRLDDLTDLLRCYLIKPRYIPKLDLFIQSLFLDHLPSSIKLQSMFSIDTHSFLTSLFLVNPSTKEQRVHQLIDKFDQMFFLDRNVQRIALCSREKRFRQIIDDLITDEKCLTFDKVAKSNLFFNTDQLKFPGLDIEILNSSFCYLTGKQQGHILNIILHDFIQDKNRPNPAKVRALRALPRFTHVFHQSLQWFDEKQKTSFVSTTVDPLDHIIICVPIKFDLTFEDLCKQMTFFMSKINASNAKYISDAMVTILRRIPQKIFLKSYLEFIHSEHFQGLGITANKEILRLLTEFASDSSLIVSVIEPLWKSRLHPDVRACLILTLLYFVDRLHSDEVKQVVWKILDEAADDNYLPVIESLFEAGRGNSRWPLAKSMDNSEEIFRTFVNRIQFKILDHPTSLEARLYAWTNISSEHCEAEKFIAKGIKLCLEFTKEAKTLWKAAFKHIMYQSEITIIGDILMKLVSCRHNIDESENALNAQHDLPVYHRIQSILTEIYSQTYRFDQEKLRSFYSLTLMILQSDKTFAPLLAKILISTARNKDDLNAAIALLEQNLPEDYFEQILQILSPVLSKSCSFIQQLPVEDQFTLIQWFATEKNYGLFVFDLFKCYLSNQSHSNREDCQNLLRQMRQSDNLLLRQQAMKYTVTWKQKKEKARNLQKRDRKSAPTVDHEPDTFDMNLLNVFE
ncbi:unnamed protein product [Adineta ricciae]|uniref:Uncharacterized protein n=2 Tax=Adineta ricciae TaxID=249248 RepID=A0A814TTW8_ADIRI|nr:unnamed protein product [Adineta ricciae]